MENSELIRRAEDLYKRSLRSNMLTMTAFLTPAERKQIENWGGHVCADRLLFCGGMDECERTAAFFLPDYMDREDFCPEEYISALHMTAHFGTPGHRDYLGALLGMGVGRERIGDIIITGNDAYVFCLPTVAGHLKSIDKVGRVSVTTEEISLSDVPTGTRELERVSFSVMSRRLDAVASGMFHLSRTEAAKHISAGNVSLNYEQCFKPDCAVNEGDIISLRGAGKGSIAGTGGTSRKGRLFVYADIYK